MADVFDLGRGTTPLVPIEVQGVNLEEVDVMWLTFKQGNVEITKELSDVTIIGNEIHAYFTQEETLRFKDSSRIYVQMRFMIGNHADKSNVATVECSGILREGVIS